MSKPSKLTVPKLDPKHVEKQLRKVAQDLVRDYAETDDTWREVCTKYGLSPSMAWGVVQTSKDLKTIVERARTGKAKLYAESTVEIADNDDRHPNHKALSIGTRKWLASAYDKDTYGNHQKLDVRQAVVNISAPIKSNVE